MSAQSLCTACGMCCDGTLFSHVYLAPEERDAAASAGLEVVPVREGEGFLQPCRQIGADRCCAIYADRPGACRRYRCTTLIALEEGTIDLASARMRVESAQA